MHDVLALPGAACESLLRVCCQIESPDDDVVGLFRNGILIVECKRQNSTPLDHRHRQSPHFGRRGRLTSVSRSESAVCDSPRAFDPAQRHARRRTLGGARLRLRPRPQRSVRLVTNFRRGPPVSAGGPGRGPSRAVQQHRHRQPGCRSTPGAATVEDDYRACEHTLGGELGRPGH